jgi:ABC-type antimicrobial peptide transport system permease subunit
MAAIGLYGVTSYGVSRRRNEIGIRMAFGATRPVVLRQVLSRVLVLVAAGAVIGAAAIWWVAQFVGALLYRVEPHDPTTLAAALTVLTAAGALAGFLPAWRAARVDPMVALRYE